MCTSSYGNDEENRLLIMLRKYKGVIFLVQHFCLGTNILVPGRLEIYSQHFQSLLPCKIRKRLFWIYVLQV